MVSSRRKSILYDMIPPHREGGYAEPVTHATPPLQKVSLKMGVPGQIHVA